MCRWREKGEYSWYQRPLDHFVSLETKKVRSSQFQTLIIPSPWIQEFNFSITFLVYRRTCSLIENAIIQCFYKVKRVQPAGVSNKSWDLERTMDLFDDIHM